MLFPKINWKYLILSVTLLQLVILIGAGLFLIYHPATYHANNETKVEAPLILILLKSKEYHLNYTFGERIPGDNIITKYNNSLRWKTPTNKTLDIFSPEMQGHNVTHVQIDVVQSSPIGAAEVIDGGIGLDFITIRLNGTNTTRMDLATKYYGVHYDKT